MAELPTIPGGWTQERVEIEDRQFLLTLPAMPDEFLEDPEVQDANERDDYMPYWSYLWPASVSMARAILRSDWQAKSTALEIGCGIGLAGLAALEKGLRVVFSDYDETAVDLAVHNARQNGYENCEGLVLDWRDPPSQTYPVILGCDVVYEKKHHEPILKLTRAMLELGGRCWIADGGRQLAENFVETATAEGFEVKFRDENGPLPDEQPSLQAGQFRILSLSR